MLDDEIANGSMDVSGWHAGQSSQAGMPSSHWAFNNLGIVFLANFSKAWKNSVK